jgi:pimeloyl-ACP methyl ester carboxylesterase
MNTSVAYGQALLPDTIRSRFADNGNGLSMHFLEAGFESAGRPLILLLHGFPEIAFSWRKIMLPLAAAGYHVVAPDQRGFGRTTGWDENYEGDYASFRLVNVVKDILGLVAALGYHNVAAVFGHDSGSIVAGWSALIRPDVFRSVVMMSAPIAGPPALPFDTVDSAPPKVSMPDIHKDLAALPRPRKHYQWYFSTPDANRQIISCPQGLHAFMRAYYHHKSADWSKNIPHRLSAWSASELAKMPTYYIMDFDEDMPQTVAHEMPSAEQIAACRWLSDEELAVYVAEYQRNEFQGGLQWYRCFTNETIAAELQLFSGRSIDVPAGFIAGKSDWGTYQFPGAFEKMQQSLLTKLWGCHLLDGAGHWVQQEQPERVTELLLKFLHDVT